MAVAPVLQGAGGRVGKGGAIRGICQFAKTDESRVDPLSLRRGVNLSLLRVSGALQNRSVVAPEFPRPEHNFASGSQ